MPLRTPEGSHNVTAETARLAVALVAPLIETLWQEPRVVGSGFFYVVVMDPGLNPAVSMFEDAILYEQGFGDESSWDADYRSFARGKARLSWSHGADAHMLQSLLPHSLRGGDTLLWGSVYLDGVVVGASGALPWFDEMLAGAVALAIRALAKEARQGELLGRAKEDE
ncbi:MAG TPA: hypothetical protein VFW68_01635 [Rhodocyclaceae bacterium]|nr:hypothetical protein [Rhodocyclaceae bacterium]